ncbi:MAG: DUF501 domain-containing protein [Candidatus Nanopelagicales bacterium]|nr:DUF501 domain-containing protein [Candidatus Nanopelagicales bacterium]
MRPADRECVSRQLGRAVRGDVSVGHRCRCGHADVLITGPRVGSGSPFPTTFYLTCPKAVAAVSTLEAGGLMAEMNARLSADPDLASRYSAAHDDYLTRRSALGEVDELSGVSAGGMPSRVKCLHALVAHSLVAGRGVNPFGDEVLDLLSEWGVAGSCLSDSAGRGAGEPQRT